MGYCKGKSVPVNLGLYNRIKSSVKRKVKRWPSAYASGQLVRMYKQKGGKYRCSSMGKLRCSSFGSLDRWFKEKWVDVCTGKPCGRKKVSDRLYPYCRPSRRISSQTPRTSKEISRSVLKKRCAIKHRIKGKRLSFGKKKNFVLNLTSIKSIKLLRSLILSTQPKNCLNWKNCKSWTYFISKPIKNIKQIHFTLKRRKYNINKKPDQNYKEYIKKSKGDSVSFYSPRGTLLVIPRKKYINIMDFTFNASPREWINLWKKVAKETKKMKKPFYIQTHGHSVNWLHIRLQKNLKY
jgi:hypothetical protein